MDENVVIEGPDADGIKTIKTYKVEDGKKVVVEQKIQVTKTTKKVSKTVQHRRQLKKFGDSKNTPAGTPDAGTIHFGEIVLLDLTPRNIGSTSNQKEDSNNANSAGGSGGGSGLGGAGGNAASLKPGGAIILCRICGKTGDHWTLKCPLKDKLGGTSLVDNAMAGRGLGSSSSGLGSSSSNSTSNNIGANGSSSGNKLDKPATVLAANATEKSGKYVPPSLRQGAGDGARRGDSMGRSGGSESRDDSNTVRVSNLSSEATEPDIRDLFQHCGPISRVYLAKDNYNVSKGFAFVTYIRREDAEKAVAKLNGHGYDHLILSVSMAAKDNK